MSATDAVAALETALESLPARDDSDAVADLAADLEDIQRRAHVVAFVDDLASRPGVEDVHLDGFQFDGDVVDVHVKLTPDFATLDTGHTAAENTPPGAGGDTTPADATDQDDHDAGDVDGAENEMADDDEETDESAVWCGRCGDDFGTERGIKIHNGRSHDADDAIILDEEPGEADLVGDHTDDVDGEADASAEDVEDGADGEDDAGEDASDETDAGDQTVSWSSPEETASEDDQEASEDDEETPLADEDADHKYSTGDQLPDDETEADETDGDGTTPGYQVDGDELDDLDDRLPEPEECVDVGTREDVTSIREFAEELGIGDTAIARVIAHRLDLYDTELFESSTAGEEGSD